ncbi:MAG: hypothetical protein ACTSUX_05700 [Promethearchaeota archaeon]
MSRKKTIDIIKTKDVLISIPKDYHFSIGTSPYYAHQNALAIDIYKNFSLQNHVALSPIEGKVLKVKELLAPRAKFKDGLNKDYLILISNSSNQNLVYKILHVRPEVTEGDHVYLGDPLGSMIRNGYFAYWSSPHLHLEIRYKNDAVRARGGMSFIFSSEIKNCFKKEKIQFERFNKPLYNVERKINKIPIKIVNVFPEFIMGRFPKEFYVKINNIIGVKGELKKYFTKEIQNCIIDGGIPMYKQGVVIFEKNIKFQENLSLFFRNCEIGQLNNTRENFGFLKFRKIKFFLNDREIKGVSLFLAISFLPLIKIIPKEINEFLLQKNEIHFLSLNS